MTQIKLVHSRKKNVKRFAFYHSKLDIKLLCIKINILFICFQIYRRHYDHTYAKKINMIYFVNDDCLNEIFAYIAVFERPKIAQGIINNISVVYSKMKHSVTVILN